MIDLNNNGWRWAQVADWLDGTDPKIGVEVGVKEGRFIDYLCNRFPKLIMYAVDPRCTQPDGEETYIDWDWNEIDREYNQRINPIKSRVIELKTFSILAANGIPDSSLDFVFLDAQHDYRSVKEDIAAWLPKVKKGGLISGHDYNADPNRNYGVIPAVNEVFGTSRLLVGRNFTWGYWV